LDHRRISVSPNVEKTNKPFPGANQEEKSTMKFMILIIPSVYRDNQQPEPDFLDPKAIAEMGKFNEWMSKSVEILSMNGLHPLTSGARLSFSKGKPTVTDGPFIETKEVLGGYWMVEAKSKEQLVELMRNCPAAEGDVIEIRQIFADEGCQSRNRGG
jgi:hypothetical protein